MDSSHQIWKIVEEDHDKAMDRAYKIYNPDWKKEEEPNNITLKEDFYNNAEVVAIVDAPSNAIELVYHQLVYEMPINNPDEPQQI